MDPSNPAFNGIIPGTTGNLDPNSAFAPAGDFGSVLGTGAGQFGLKPVLSNGGGGMAEAVQDVWEWLNTPFKAPMSPTGIFALVGSVLVAILLWNMILYHIRIAGESL